MRYTTCYKAILKDSLFSADARTVIKMKDRQNELILIILEALMSFKHVMVLQRHYMRSRFKMN